MPSVGSGKPGRPNNALEQTGRIRAAHSGLLLVVGWLCPSHDPQLNAGPLGRPRGGWRVEAVGKPSAEDAGAGAPAAGSATDLVGKVKPKGAALTSGSSGRARPGEPRG